MRARQPLPSCSRQSLPRRAPSKSGDAATPTRNGNGSLRSDSPPDSVIQGDMLAVLAGRVGGEGEKPQGEERLTCAVTQKPTNTAAGLTHPLGSSPLSRSAVQWALRLLANVMEQEIIAEEHHGPRPCRRLACEEHLPFRMTHWAWYWHIIGMLLYVQVCYLLCCPTATGKMRRHYGRRWNGSSVTIRPCCVCCMCVQIHTYICTYIHTYIHTSMTVSLTSAMPTYTGVLAT